MDTHEQTKQNIRESLQRLERIALAQFDEPQDPQVAKRIAEHGKRKDVD